MSPRCKHRPQTHTMVLVGCVVALVACCTSTRDDGTRKDLAVTCPSSDKLANLSRPGTSPSGYQAVIVQGQTNQIASDLEIRGRDGNVELLERALFGSWFPMIVIWDDQDRLWVFSNDFGLVYYAKVIDIHHPPCAVPPYLVLSQWQQCSPNSEATPPHEMVTMMQSQQWCSSRY